MTEETKLSPPIIVCAANRSNVDGLLVLGARHFDACMRKAIDLSGRKHTEFVEQGFIDQHCNFYTREEAFEIAENNGQIKRILGTEHRRELYSENLY